MAELVGGGWTDWTDCGMLAPSGGRGGGHASSGMNGAHFRTLWAEGGAEGGRDGVAERGADQGMKKICRRN